LGALAPKQARPLSLSDRCALMQQTVSMRVCSGRSGIHGLGVFAKVPHQAGVLCVCVSTGVPLSAAAATAAGR
jgi:hypothetical protein